MMTWRTYSRICTATVRLVHFLLREESIRGKSLPVSTFQQTNIWSCAHESFEAKICMDRRKVRS
jgi:hypothetical protein